MSTVAPTAVKVIHRTDANVSGIGELKTKHLNPPDRLINAVKALAICWVIAVLCIAVPVLHFFLVPAAILAGVLMFFVKFSHKEYREAGTVTCPACKTPITIKRGSFNWPIRETCNSCRISLSIAP